MGSTNQRLSGARFRRSLTALLLSLVALAAAGLSACGDRNGVPEENRAVAPTPAAAPPAPAKAPPTAAEPAAAALTESAPSAPMETPPVPALERGKGVGAKVTLAGDLKSDGSASAACAIVANGSLQVSLTLSDATAVQLRLESFRGAGDYDGEAQIRPNETVGSGQPSKAVIKAKIEVTTTGKDKKPVQISGAFAGRYLGGSGKGTVTGTFRNCPYKVFTENG